MKNLLHATGVLVIFVAGVAAANPPIAAESKPDYEAEFAKRFPGVAGGHRVVDWALYTALVAGDIVTYAARIDPAVAKQLEETRGRPYQTYELEQSIQKDQRLRTAFNQQRRGMGSMVLFMDGDGTGTDPCRHPLVYVASEFRLVLGESNQGGDPLARATIAPGCPQALDPGFQLTAGRSTRFKCWAREYGTSCGWRLPDMPLDLKRVVEKEYPASIKLRWRWQGLGRVLRVRYIDSYGNRVAERDSISLTVPHDLRLEFLDAEGKLLWSAPATGPLRVSSLH